jgi:hypothetical protein
MRSLTFLLLSSLSAPLWADPQIQQMNARIDASAQAQQGNLMLNQASGHQHQQANTRAIAARSAAGASTRVEQWQDQQFSNNEEAIGTNASIAGASFSYSSGVLGVNQSAGRSNQQINAFRMTSSVLEGLDDSVLAQQSVMPSVISGAVGPQSGERIASVDDRAFSSSRGVVQLNQSAGIGNRSINNLGIRVSE